MEDSDDDEEELLSYSRLQAKSSFASRTRSVDTLDGSTFVPLSSTTSLSPSSSSLSLSWSYPSSLLLLADAKKAFLLFWGTPKGEPCGVGCNKFQCLFILMNAFYYKAILLSPYDQSPN